MRAQPKGLLRVTVIVRWIPLVTAAYGTWVARPARTTSFARGRDGFQLGRRVRPILASRRLAGKSPEGSRQPVERLDLHFAYLRRPRSGAIGPATCGIYERSARSCPLLSIVRPPGADPARTKPLERSSRCPRRPSACR